MLLQVRRGLPWWGGSGRRQEGASGALALLPFLHLGARCRVCSVLRMLASIQIEAELPRVCK